ncbi:MAG: hypothetical protein KBT40_04775 [bacterium]|nr:hypothetical protein [Candidatus Minthenecus merdequi]
MKKIIFFAFILLAAVSCKKDKNTDDSLGPTLDPRDAFVGEYELNVNANISIRTSDETISGLIPENIPYEKQFSLVITKDTTKENQVNVSGFYNCTAIVSGNNLILESSTETQNIKPSDFISYELFDGITIPVTYSLVHKTATLENDQITWHTDATGSASVNIVLTTIDFTGSAAIENTAYKLPDY